MSSSSNLILYDSQKYLWSKHRRHKRSHISSTNGNLHRRLMSFKQSNCKIRNKNRKFRILNLRCNNNKLTAESYCKVQNKRKSSTTQGCNRWNMSCANSKSIIQSWGRPWSKSWTSRLLCSRLSEARILRQLIGRMKCMMRWSGRGS